MNTNIKSCLITKCIYICNSNLITRVKKLEPFETYLAPLDQQSRMTYLPFNMTSQETTCSAFSNIVYYNNVTFQHIIVPYKLPKWFNVWRLIVTLEASEAFLCICSQRTQNSERFGYGIFVAMDSR